MPIHFAAPRIGGAHPISAFAAFLLVLLTSAGCTIFTSDDPPVERERFVEAVVDLHLLQAREALGYPVTEALRDSVLDHHGLDRESYRTAIAYYTQQPEDYVTFYNEVLDRLNAEAMGTPE